MSRFVLSSRVPGLTSLVCLAATAAFFASRPAYALGPNLMSNTSFEGGAYGYKGADTPPFRIVDAPTHAHTGVRALRVKVQPSGSCSLKLALHVWRDTSYTTSVWYEGDGSLQLQVTTWDGSAELAHVDFTAGARWKQARVTFRTGNVQEVQVRVRELGGKGTAVYLDDIYTGLTDGHTIAFDADHPASHGFKLLWGDDFSSPGTIDVKNTKAGGYHWYLASWFGLADTKPSMFSVHDGLLTITDCPVTFSETLHTAAPADNPDGFVGTAFRDTAPLYYEARFRVRDFDKSGTTKGDPGFWEQALSMETCIGREMPGHPGHGEMIENDFVEMNHTWGGLAGEHISGIGDWCDGNVGKLCTQWPPVGTDYGQFHTYGCLVVPATAANGWHGYRTVYFDGVPMVSVCWLGNQEYHGVFPETIDSFGSYWLSRLDHDWEEIILGDGQGGVSPMDFDYVRVYGMSPTSLWVHKAGPATPPRTPTDLAAVPGDGQVSLSWTGTARVYRLYRGTAPGAVGDKPLTTLWGNLSYTDKKLSNGTTYYYTMVAVNDAGASGKSKEVSARPGPDGPNLLADPGFEKGGAGWTIRKPFAVMAKGVTAGAAKPHAGSAALAATLPARPSGATVSQRVAVAKDTFYAAGLWVHGEATFQVLVLDHAHPRATPLAILNVVATLETWNSAGIWDPHGSVKPKKPGTWEHVALPVFNSGNCTAIDFVIRDGGGGGGPVQIDDCDLHGLALSR